MTVPLAPICAVFILYYFPRPIKNEGRGLPPALTRAAAAWHTNTRAGSGGPPGHSGALFWAVHESPLSGTTPEWIMSKLLFLGNLKHLLHEGRWMAQEGCYLSPCDTDA